MLFSASVWEVKGTVRGCDAAYVLLLGVELCHYCIDLESRQLWGGEMNRRRAELVKVLWLDGPVWLSQTAAVYLLFLYQTLNLHLVPREIPFSDC